MTASVVLIDPKYPHNVGQVVRAASCFAADRVWFTGDRVSLEGGKREQRLPREERMREYRDVDLRHIDRRRVFELLPAGAVPVAVEFMAGAESLADFEHPEDAMYVFGPEDGSLGAVQLRHCHRFVRIPAAHCVNLAAAVYLTLYDRMTKRRGVEPSRQLADATPPEP